MEYPQEPKELEVRDKTIGLLRQALIPVLKDKATAADVQKLAENLYTEMANITDRLEKRIDANKPKDVDMNPIAKLMLAVTELAKREIKNEVKVDLPEVQALTEKVDSAIGYMKEQSDKQTELIKTFTTPKTQPKEAPEATVRIANFEDFAKVGKTEAIFSAKFPFTSEGRNVAVPLMQTASGLALPVVDLSADAAGGGNGLTDTQLRATPVTVSGVGSEGRSWTLASGIDNTRVANFPTVQTVKNDVGNAYLQNRYGGGKLTHEFSHNLATASGILTPPSGKRIELYFATATGDPDNSNSPRIRILWEGAVNALYTGYGISHWEKFTGAANQRLMMELNAAGSVDGVIHYLFVD